MGSYCFFVSELKKLLNSGGKGRQGEGKGWGGEGKGEGEREGEGPLKHL